MKPELRDLRICENRPVRRQMLLDVTPIKVEENESPKPKFDPDTIRIVPRHKDKSARKVPLLH